MTNPGFHGALRPLLHGSRARVFAGMAVLCLPAIRCAADMGTFNSEKAEQYQAQSGDNGPQLSDKISDGLEQLKPLVDAKNWDAAIAQLDSMAASVDPNTYQGGYDTAVILDTKAKTLVEADRLEEAIAPWEGTLALCTRHPSYYYQSQVSDIVHYLSQLYSQVGTSIKVTPGPDLEERQQKQRRYIEKSVSYLERWMKNNPKVTQDDELYLADALFNLASTATGHDATDLFNQATDAAQKGLLMAVNPKEGLYYVEAAAAEQNGNLERAAEVLELLLQRNPDNKSYPPQLMVIYLNLAGTAKQEVNIRKYYVRAINAIERAQAHGLMNDQKTNLNLVTIYYDMGEFAQATQLLDTDLKNGGIDPAEKNWQILAYCYQQLDENKQAIDAYKDAEKLYPGNGQFDFSIGQIYTSMDDLDDAYHYYLAAEQKGNVTVPYALYINIAYCAFELQKFDEGLKACDEAAKYPQAAKDLQLPQLRAAIEDRIKQQDSAKKADAAAAL
jgi:tetratricopeptide (TPR) repeat protein